MPFSDTPMILASAPTSWELGSAKADQAGTCMALLAQAFADHPFVVGFQLHWLRGEGARIQLLGVGAKGYSSHMPWGPARTYERVAGDPADAHGAPALRRVGAARLRSAQQIFSQLLRQVFEFIDTNTLNRCHTLYVGADRATDAASIARCLKMQALACDIERRAIAEAVRPSSFGARSRAL